MAEFSPDSMLSHNRVLSKIGAGDRGEVYLAADTSELGRTVANQNTSSCRNARQRKIAAFYTGSCTVADLNHANILTAVVVGAVIRGRPSV